MNVFSFMANGIAIALAFVAMYTSFKQNSDNQTLTTQMSETLARMDEKINSMGQKVSEFSSVEGVKKLLEARLNQAAETIEDSLSDDKKTITVSDVIEIFNKEMSNFGISLDQLIKDNNSGQNVQIRSYGPDFNIREPKNFVRETVELDFGYNEFTLNEMRDRVLSKYKEDIPLSLLRLILLDLVQSNYLERIIPVKDENKKRLQITYKKKEK